MNNPSPILSILVITHNQRDLLKRCLQSVLAQELNVPFEVIVSDDRSADGTKEWITAYQQEIINRQQNGELPNLVELRYVHCNSDECDPKNVSERCGWNKLTVYSAARGEYFVNIDADDYLRSTDIYQIQLDMLIAHPECSMCMQDVWQVQNGADESTGFRWPTYGKVGNGHIFTVKDIIGDYRALNPCYMTRSHPEDNMRELYGKYFDDTIITQHHLQYGPVVFVDRADYVWIQYKTSITKTLTGDDSLLEYAFLQLHHVKMIPQFKNEFMEAGLRDMIHFFKVLTNKHFKLELTERTLANYRTQEGFIYYVFTKDRITIFDKIRLMFIRCVLIAYKRFGWSNYKLLYKLLV